MRPLTGIRGAAVWLAEWAVAGVAVAAIAELTVVNYHARRH